MTTTERISATVHDYLRLLQDGTATELVALFADNAVLVDPVGSEPKRGEALVAHFEQVEALSMRTRLLALRIAGGEAVAYFEVLTTMGEQEYAASPIDRFTFAADGRIASLEAYWGPADETPAYDETA